MDCMVVIASGRHENDSGAHRSNDLPNPQQNQRHCQYPTVAGQEADAATPQITSLCATKLCRY
jgi:hypothetical protein